MGYKEDFLAAINEALPEGISGLLDKEIPEAPSVTVTDVDSAIIATGHLSKYFLDLFNTFKGLTPVELLLRIGQKNATLQAGVLIATEYIKKESFDFTIVFPTTATYTRIAGDDFICSVSFPDDNSFDACTGVSIVFDPQIAESTSLERNEENRTFLKNFPMIQAPSQEILEVVARFTASFEDADDFTQAIGFGIRLPQ